jgi:hypothetical protein
VLGANDRFLMIDLQKALAGDVPHPGEPRMIQLGRAGRL